MSEEELFHQALQKPPAERAAYLDEVCRGDDALRRRVEVLLGAHESPGSFLAAPPVGRPAETVDQPVSDRPDDVVGSYKLLEQIGEGGFGVVFLAEQTEPVRRKVALKVLKPGMDSRQVVARFEAERQALAIMDHPNIARVFDGGATPSGRPYFVMELVKGVPITEFCDRNHLTPRQRLELFVPVCQAVQHAHQKGIIHRDIKPSNVLVSRHDTTPVVKVIDFGVAKALGRELTDKTLFTGLAQMIGTPLYMSPEQAGMSDLDVDTRSDIYSLGVLLYELLTGTTPFTKERFRQAAYDEIRRILREEEPPKPSTRLSESKDSLPAISAERHTEPARLTKLVRGELDWIVMKALEKDRNRRYETANGFAMDVQRYLADEPVQACPPSVGYRFRKFTRRNKGGLAVAALVLSFLVILGSGVGWAVRDRSAREAEAHRQQAARQARAGGKVESILAEVDRLEGEQKWPEALAAVQRAGAVVAGGDADAPTAERVRDRLRDLEFIDRLERIRMLPPTSAEGGGFTKADGEYAQAFRDYGVDILGLPVEVSIERLKVRRGLAIRLGAALDHWGFLRRALPERDAVGWKQLAAIASGIDPEPLRARLRSMGEQPAARMRDELRRLAESIDVRVQPRETLLILARTLSQAGLPDSALRILREAQSIHPGDFLLNHSLAFELSGQGDHEGALRFFTAAAALRPDSLGAYDNIGICLHHQKKLDEAVAAYRKGLELHPKFASYENLSTALGAQKKWDEATAVCRKAIERYPEVPHYRFVLGRVLRGQGNVDEADAAFGKAIELAHKRIDAEPKSAGVQYTLIGNILLEQGKPDEAIAAWHKAVELDPKAYNGYVQLALALTRRGDRDGAIAAYRKFIEIDPIRGGTWRNNLGNLLRERGKLDEALAVYREAIEFRANNGEAYNGIGNVRSDQKKPDEAIAMFHKAIEVDPKHVAAYLNLGQTLTEQKKPDEAIPYLRKAIEIDPAFAPAREFLGDALRAQKKPYEAVEAYRTATELEPSRVAPHINLGKILFEQKRPDEAIATYSKAIEVNPNTVAGVYAHIQQLSKDKDFAALGSREDFKTLVAAVEAKRALNARAAVALAEKSVAEAPTDANRWHTLGVKRYDAGDFEGAIAALQKYHELCSDDAEWTNPFRLAMAHWRLGNTEEARRWYDRGARWMDAKSGRATGTMIRIRNEAAALLKTEPPVKKQESKK